MCATCADPLKHFEVLNKRKVSSMVSTNGANKNLHVYTLFLAQKHRIFHGFITN